MEKTSETPKELNQTQTGPGGVANRQNRQGSEKRPNSHVTEKTSSKGPELSTILSAPTTSIASQVERKSTLASYDPTLDSDRNETVPWSLNM